jgi:hypothetical protein
MAVLAGIRDSGKRNDVSFDAKMNVHILPKKLPCEKAAFSWKREIFLDPTGRGIEWSVAGGRWSVLAIRYQGSAFSQQNSQDKSRKIGWTKPQKRGKNEFWHGLGIVIYVSKSMFFNRGVSKFIVFSIVTGFFEGTFGCGG